MHDVLEANQDAIKKLVSWWIQTKSSNQGRKILNLDDVEEMFSMVPKGGSATVKQECQLRADEIILAFANSKFPIVDEMTHAHHLSTMKLDEVYEFICRIADLARFTGAGSSTPPNEEEDKSENNDAEEDE